MGDNTSRWTALQIMANDYIGLNIMIQFILQYQRIDLIDEQSK